LYEMTLKRQMPGLRGEGESSSFSESYIDDYMSRVEGTQKIDRLLPSVQTLNYKMIILDLPSISEGAAAVKSAGLANGVILIIESEKVRREVVMRAKERLEKAGAQIIGVVLNKRKYYIPRWLYKKL